MPIPIPLAPSVPLSGMTNPAGAGSSGPRRLAARRLLPSCTLSPERPGTAPQAPFRHLAQGAGWLSLLGRAAPRVSFSPGVPDLSAFFRARGASTLTPPFRGSSLGCPLVPRGVEHPSSLRVPRVAPWVIAYCAPRVLSTPSPHLFLSSHPHVAAGPFIPPASPGRPFFLLVSQGTPPRRSPSHPPFLFPRGYSRHLLGQISSPPSAPTRTEMHLRIPPPGGRGLV